MDEKVKELYLAHHGVKGQKWGIRKYQNEDGTLTAEGKARYLNSMDYTKGGESKLHSMLSGKGKIFGSQTNRERLIDKSERARDYYAKDPKTRETLDKQIKAQKAMKANYDAYTRHSSTAKLVMQNLMMTPFGASRYRAARASGSGRLSSWIESGGVLGMALHMYKNKKRYGSAAVWGDREEGINFKENMDE